ncbi:sigma 54-interacting transcriptional regulator [Aliifodinibius sp. S!AR15-10]|uniref:sigma 54-interacting transcriptional regulator n=1 Tax=Aliifodinibius sp. S!AR15-10 TaxID=2950437 RepID=UPI00285B6C45|nr:sigma 54-interacting transcriptional regulator [Aliifodinibius sp. S!AR15-10]MDR8390224.1 sigma 54-interacting transcriptional regulator [Aliifodinibius sp. S!AR15-10]
MKTLSDKPINLDLPKNGAQIETVNFYSEIMHDLYKQIVDIAPTDKNIILVGEQGTGKHRTAKLIHSLSSFSDGPFGNLFCNTLEETIQEKMRELERTLEEDTYQSSEDFGLDFLSGGTLFFNSFSELSQLNRRILVRLVHNAQKMAQHAEEISNSRLIISIQQDSYTDLADKPYWDELVKQLNPTIIHIPPLRERCEDITLLIDQFLIDHAVENDKPVHAISPRAVYKCISYHWPGNIRQLKNTIEHAATAVSGGSVITADQLPFSIDWKSPYSNGNTTMEYNKSFLRAEQMLLKELVGSSEMTDQDLQKVEFEFKIPFRNRKIFLS